MTAAAHVERIQELNDRAVATLVREHAARSDEPLVLAVRWVTEDPTDIALLEVLDGFSGEGSEELLVTEFEPSARFCSLRTEMERWG